MAEWSVCWIHNPAVPGSIPALVTCTCWSCSLSFRVQIQGHVFIEQTAAAVGVLNPVIPLSPNSVQQQVSPNDIHTLS